jgi:hypothetical protein
MVDDDPETSADLDGHCDTHGECGAPTADCVAGPCQSREDDPYTSKKDWVPHGQCHGSTGCHIADGVGHHIISLFRHVFLPGSIGRQVIDKLVTGPLADATKNFFNGPHRLYNQAVEGIKRDMEKELGLEFENFGPKELLQLGRRIFDSTDTRITNFIDQLGETKAGQTARQALGTALDAAEGFITGATELVFPVAVKPPCGQNCT